MLNAVSGIYEKIVCGVLVPHILKFVYTPLAVDHLGLIKKTAHALDYAGASTAGFSSAGRDADLLSWMESARRWKRRPLRFSRDDLDIQFAIVAAHNLEFFYLKLDDRYAVQDWAPLFVADPALIMGWHADYEYDYWQNADDFLEYKAAGRSVAGLPTKRRDLPPPLNDLIVDTSNNPGRSILRNGFIEVVASTMWLSDKFWILAGTSRDRVVNVDWLSYSEIAPGVLRIDACRETFTSSDGASAGRQSCLRSLLFKR